MTGPLLHPKDFADLVNAFPGAGDVTETFRPPTKGVPDLNPPRSRKVARRQAAHDAKVLRRMAAEDRRAWQARRAAERAEQAAAPVVTLPDGSLSIDGRLLTIAEETGIEPADVATLIDNATMVGQGSPTGVCHAWTEGDDA